MTESVTHILRMSFFKTFFRNMNAEGQLYSQFLDLVHLTDGKADTILAAIKEVLYKKKLPTEKLYGLGTYGAAVMTGMNLLASRGLFWFFSYISEHEVSENMNLSLVLICFVVVAGQLHGVKKQLQDSFPWLLSVACAAHRLAPADRDASSEVPLHGYPQGPPAAALPVLP